MDFNKLSMAVSKYINKLEHDFTQEDYELDFIIKKLDNYIYAFHQDMKFNLLEEIEDQVKINNIKAVEQKIRKPIISNLNNFKESGFDGKFTRILNTLENFEERYKRKYENREEAIIPNIYTNRPDKYIVMELEKQIKSQIENDFNISIKNKRIEMYVNQIIESFANGEFINKSGRGNSNLSKIKNIKEEVLRILRKRENSKCVLEVFSEYKEYLKKCINEYESATKLDDVPYLKEEELENIYNLKEDRLEDSPSLKEDKVERNVKPIIDYIEICYSNGEKRKLSFKKLCTPEQIAFLEEKIKDVIKLDE